MKSTISRSVFSKVGEEYLRIRKFQRCASTLSYNSGHPVLTETWKTIISIIANFKCWNYEGVEGFGLKHFVSVNTERVFDAHWTQKVQTNKF